MSAKILGQIWDYVVDGDERVVLQALADRCEHDGTAARPSIARIVWMTDFQERKVQRVLSRLRERGVLKVTRRSGYRRPTEYRIALGVLPRKVPFKSAEKGDTVVTQVEGAGARGDGGDTAVGDTGSRKGDTAEAMGDSRIEKGAAPSTKVRHYSSTHSSLDSSNDSSRASRAVARSTTSGDLERLERLEAEVCDPLVKASLRRKRERLVRADSRAAS